MSWATFAIEKLKAGETVVIKPHGNSMTGKIKSGQACIIKPVDTVAVDDIVLCRVKGNDYLHLVHAMRDGQYLIGNNRGGRNGWITINNIFGKFAGFA